MSLFFKTAAAAVPQATPANSPVLVPLSAKIEAEMKGASKEQIELVTRSSVAAPVAASVKRAMGRRTFGMSTRSGKADVIFSMMTGPPKGIGFKPKLNAIYTFTRQISVVSWITSSNVGETNYASAPSLSSFNGYGDLTSLFDQYRITLLEYWIIPRVNYAGTSDNPGRLYSVIDLDDAATVSIAQCEEYNSCLVSGALDGHYRAFQPHAAIAAYSGAFTSYANLASPWIDCASTGVLHYGLKAAISATATNGQILDLVIRATIQVKNVR